MIDEQGNPTSITVEKSELKNTDDNPADSK
ncbi:hypothetical protein A1232T_01543 [Psychrobacter piechaudii]|uniref:Uncharacterized protein n=1 Tax=Psychrobacter piechaudii TaxID=1945521 RepID=A0A1R4GV78_9GAMM|nr:hypothetical protein A1232T_01543 [Psychrobacter piechaudii]